MAPGTPVPQVENGKKCYCCCSCFSYDTPILINEGVFAPIQSIQLKQYIPSTGPSLGTWSPREVTYSDGMGPDLTFTFTYTLCYRYQVGDEPLRFMIVTADHLYLMADGKLKAVQMLVSGDQLRRADGATSEVVFSVRGNYTGGLHHISLGDFDGHDLNGHLINANGLVSSDYIVQLCYSSGALDQNLISDSPQEMTADFRGMNAAATAFVNDRAQWPQGFTPQPVDSQFNIPLYAHRFLTDKQAEDVRMNGEYSSPGNVISISQADYLYSVYDALGPDLIYLNDWNNEAPNAYSWMAGGQRLVVMTGGLLRLYGLSLEGLALILAHMVAMEEGAKCVGEGDYQSTYNYFRRFWLDELFFYMTERALAQIRHLFSLVSEENSGGNPELPCYDPSLDCRMTAFERGVGMLGVPECALPKNPFGVTSATVHKKHHVNVTFSRPVNPPSAETAQNYSIVPTEGEGVVMVQNAVLTRPADTVIVLSVEGLDPATKYVLTVQNVLSATNAPLDPNLTQVEFETA
ncbi:MAG TPA: hypothetical protein VIX89_11255 [Bryobacteraceae bacterium]